MQIQVTSDNGTNSKTYPVEDPWATEALVRLQSLHHHSKAMKVKVAAFNNVGLGPYSEEKSIAFDPRKDPTLYYNEHFESSSAQYTWLIALLGSLAFMLLLVSFVMVYYRQKPKYLAANTSDSTDNYHCTLKSATTQNGQLWIDRYFEKEQTSKLLSVSATMPNVKDTNSDYAYIDNSDAASSTANNRHSLSTFAGQPLSMSTSIATASTVIQPPNAQLMSEPEPYATTDILRAEKEKLQHHYAVIIGISFSATIRALH